MSVVEKVNLFQRLPDEVFVRVFSNLTPQELTSIVAKVCKRWWIISQDPSLWTRLDLVVNTSKRVEDVFNTIRKRCSSLRCLTILAWSPSASSLACMFPLLPKLKQLKLVSCEFDLHNVRTIINSCTSIETISLAHCDNFDIQCINTILSLPKLRSIEITGCEEIDDSCLELIARKCSSLKRLDICGHWQAVITDIGIRLVVNYHSSSLTELCLYLRYLSDASVSDIATCTNLSTLRLQLSHQDLLTDKSLEALSSLTNLKVLQLCGSNFTKAALRDFFTRPCLALLEELDIDRLAVDDDILDHLLEIADNLRILEFSNCKEMSNNGLLSVISKCGELRSLTLRFMSQLTGEPLASALTSLLKLKHLGIFYCWRFDKCRYFQNLVQNMPDIMVKHAPLIY